MITVVFQCSSPYVGYTTRVADYQKKEMTECSARRMTELGMRVFQVSGTYAILMDIKQRKYFHARQSDSCVLDEQGRRIYNNVAFVGAQGDERDSRIITDIALYELFNADRFYRELAEMIHLTDEGFYVDYEKLELFLKRFEAGVQCKTTHSQVRNLYEDIRRPSSNKMIRFVVLEATWEYFVKQVGNDFGGSVDWKLTLSDMKTYASQAEVGFVSEAGDGRTAKPTEAAAAEEEKTGEQQGQPEEGPSRNNPVASNHPGTHAKIMIIAGVASVTVGAALATLVCRIIF